MSVDECEFPSKIYDTHQLRSCQQFFEQKSICRDYSTLHKNDGEYHCNVCTKSFTVEARLKRHHRIHTGEKPHQCEYCNKRFSVKENLSVHRRIHTKERPYKCDICLSAFEHSGKLHRHMRIHTGERPHQCSHCNKTFIQSGQLIIHMRTHTGEKPYLCKSCGKKFTCSKQLKVHSRTHTGEKPYKCDICGKSFGYNHVLKLHQVAHYGEKVYKCTLCQETFSSKKSMDVHVRTQPRCSKIESHAEFYQNQITNAQYQSKINQSDNNFSSNKNKKRTVTGKDFGTEVHLNMENACKLNTLSLIDSFLQKFGKSKHKEISEFITDQCCVERKFPVQDETESLLIIPTTDDCSIWTENRRTSVDCQELEKSGVTFKLPHKSPRSKTVIEFARSGTEN